MKRVALALLLACTACVTIVDGRLPPVERQAATGVLQAGAAMRDITPPPGFPMGGHSIAGRVARGHWGRLHARAIYVQAPNGGRVALVSCDLWSIPGGLPDRVAELLHEREGVRDLGRENLLIAATHTHQSPGNFSTAEAYNELGSTLPGFSEALFESLAGSIAAAIAEARQGARPARLALEHMPRMRGLVWNRSIDAYLLDADWRADAAGRDVRNARASGAGVDERLRVLRVDAADGAPLARALFLSVHPTVMGNATELYQADLFGAVAAALEGDPAHRAHAPVVALFNGAEGDAVPDAQVQTALELERLAAIVTEAAGAEPVRVEAIDGELLVAFDRFVPMRAQPVYSDHARRVAATADEPAAGIPTLGGAEEQRTAFFEIGFREGMRGGRTLRGQGPKYPTDPNALVDALVRAARAADDPDDYPEYVPLGVYRIGSLVLATLPGEFTHMMGRRIEREIATSLGDGAEALLVGLAGEYLSYFTTPEEFELQHYEGASTLWGAHAGEHVGAQLARLAREAKAPEAIAEGFYEYRAGRAVEFGPAGVEQPVLLPDDGLAAILVGADGMPRRDFPRICWAAPDLRPPSAVEVQERVGGGWSGAAGRWGRIADRTPDVAVVLVDVEQRRWCAHWATAFRSPAAAATWRFRVRRADGSAICSLPFDEAAGFEGDENACGAE